MGGEGRLGAQGRQGGGLAHCGAIAEGGRIRVLSAIALTNTQDDLIMKGQGGTVRGGTANLRGPR